MPLTVYKYDLKGAILTERVMLPKGAQILHIASQHDGAAPQLWAFVETSAPPEPFGIVVRGTGHQFNGTEGRHLGTVLMDGGHLVWHFFERVRP